MTEKPRFLDTLTEKIQSLPRVSKKRPLKFFVCGPTVYDVLHIGNGRTYLVFDTLVRYLRTIGLPVFYLQNITDVDDKIIDRAVKEGVPPRTVARRYQKIYLANMKKLGITTVTKYAPATEFIPQIVAQIEKLLAGGHVYRTGDGYYFDLKTFPDYGKLARRTVHQAEDGVSRIDDGVQKRNRGDFCVWKFSKSGEPRWKTSLGVGRPGWHIEDTAISEFFFGPQYDIHGGGVDLKFPHHEAEIAQQESASGRKPFVKIWLHVGALTVDGKKMSKSLGNYVSIDDFLKDYESEVLRVIALSNHYRTPLNYTKELAETSRKNWKTLQELIWKLEFVITNSPFPSRKKETKNLLTKATEHFFAALANDFNTPEALSVLYTLSSKTPWSYSAAEARLLKEGLEKLLLTLGLQAKPLTIPLRIKRLLSAREKARNSKQFIQSDALRKEINDLGYNLDDTPLGQFVRPS